MPIVSSAIAMPATSGYTRFNLSSRHKVGMQRGEFDGAIQIQDWLVDWWEASISLPPMPRATAVAWITFLRTLRGPFGTFMLRLPLGMRTPRGANSSSAGGPMVNGNHAVGARTLSTRNWTGSVAGILKAGDYIQADNYLYEIQGDEDTNPGGDISFDIFPATRTALGDTARIITSDPRGLFRLADITSSLDLDEASLYGISFKAVEAI